MLANGARKLLRNVGLLAVASQLVAFTGAPKNGDLIELKSEMGKLKLNGRSSAHFRASDHNVTYKLEAGTRGVVQKVQKFSNGNAGVCLEVKNSDSVPSGGDCIWIYFRSGSPNLNLYSYADNEKHRSAKLAEWAKDGKKVSLEKVGSPEKAHVAETTKPVVALEIKREISSAKPEASKSQQSSSGATAADAQTILVLVTDAQSKMSSSNQSCADCELAALAGTELKIKAPTSRSMAPRCSLLMDSNGKMGEGGEALFKIMSEDKYVSSYTKSNALGSYCPKFNNLSRTEKLQAWTWFWTALAQEEASCKVNAHHGTTYTKNGRRIVLNPREGYGLWAMERDRNVRRSRGQACNSIGNVEGQARCSIDIMMKKQLSQGSPASGNIGYWGPIRREYKDHQLMPHMKRFSLCF